MIEKDKVFVVSSNVDDSIKSTVLHMDVYVFNTFDEFESYVDVTPIDAAMIVVNSIDLPFTSSSISRLFNIVDSTFVNLTGVIYYMVDDESIESKFETVINKHGYQDIIKSHFSRSLYAKDVSDILTGDSLDSRETITEVRTYRIRASEYVKMQKEKEGIDYNEAYETDEDTLSGIPDEEMPEDLRTSITRRVVKHTICSNSLLESTVWAFLKAQYLATSGRVLIVENDWEYHTLLDIVTKSGVDCGIFYIEDLYNDVTNTINSIKAANERLIVVASKKKMEFDYNIILNMLVANLDTTIDSYVYTTTLSNIPYGDLAEVVIPTTVPEILKAVQSMSSVREFNDLTFVGLNLNSLGTINVTQTEFKDLLTMLWQRENINTICVSTNGVVLKKEVGLGGVFMHTKYNN